MGIDALGRLIKINPDIAEEHQLAVIDCLEVRAAFIFSEFTLLARVAHVIFPA